MTKRLIPGIGKTRPWGRGVDERDGLNGSRSCGLHQGQRSYEPRAKAGHMTAPDQLRHHRQKHLAKRGPSTHVPGFEDTELGVLMEPEVGLGTTEIYAGVQA